MKLLLPISNEDFFLDSLPDTWITSLKNQTAFKLFVPKAFGGLALSLQTGVEHLIQSAETHPGLGWVHNLCAGANYFCGLFDTETAQTIYSTEHVITSGSGTPNGSYTELENTYKISGEWHKCSGAEHATHFTVSAFGKNRLPQTFIVPASLVKINKTWSSFGLMSSSSHSIVLKDAEIPKNYTFEIGNVKNHIDYQIYRYPFEFFARICLSATYEGICRLFISKKKEILAFKRDKIQKDLDSVERSLNELYSTRKSLISSCDQKLESKTNSELETENFYQEAYQKLGASHYTIFQKTMHCFWNGGIQFSETTNPINAILKDLMTASQHYMLK